MVCGDAGELRKSSFGTDEEIEANTRNMGYFSNKILAIACKMHGYFSFA